MLKNILAACIIGICLIFGLLYFANKKPNKPPFNKKTIMNKTFAIIKPNAVKEGNADKIIDMIEANGFDIIGMKKITMTKEQAEKFYAIHKDRPFFKELVDMMTSGPVIVMVLQKDNAIKAWRDLMGATNPAEAAEGTIRKKFGKSIGENATHGSDSPENAHIEIEQFFPELL